MKKYAVIVGGGSGTRMGESTPKQFLLLNEKPLIWHTVKRFIEAYEDIEIILVLPEAWLDKGRVLLIDLDSELPIKFCAGGNSRFHSVLHGLQLVTEKSIVFIHDAVRCLVSVPLIRRCYQHALEKGSAIPVIDAKDSVRIIEANGNRGVDRHCVKLVQTPQTFRSEIILQAYQQQYKESFTDEAMVAEAMGETVSLLPGDPQNIKITFPMDLIIAEKILSDKIH